MDQTGFPTEQSPAPLTPIQPVDDRVRRWASIAARIGATPQLPAQGETAAA